VADVAGELSRLPDRQQLGLLTDGELHMPGQHEKQLARTRRVRFGAVCLARFERPVPQLHDIGRVNAGDQCGLATGCPAPEHGGLPRADDAQRSGTLDVDQRWQPDAQRVTEPQQRGDARVARALLDIDHHAPTDARALRQLVQRPAAIKATVADAGAHCASQVQRLHGATLLSLPNVVHHSALTSSEGSAMESKDANAALNWRPHTAVIAAGRTSGAGQPLNVPLVLASTFRAAPSTTSTSTAPAATGREYARDDGTLTWEALEQIIGELQGGAAVAFSSGMAAAAAVLDLLPVGSRVVAPSDCYAGVKALLAAGQQQGRWIAALVDVTDTDAVLAAAAEADLLWLESPTWTRALLISISKECCRCSRTAVTRPSSCGLLKAVIAARIEEIALRLSSRASLRSFTRSGWRTRPTVVAAPQGQRRRSSTAGWASGRAWDSPRRSRATCSSSHRRSAG
jgi:hypothetical protein